MGANSLRAFKTVGETGKQNLFIFLKTLTQDILAAYPREQTAENPHLNLEPPQLTTQKF